MSNGTRTRDILDHNQVLYQLSYTHHVRRLFPCFPPAEKKSTGSLGVLAPSFRLAGSELRHYAWLRLYASSGRTCLAAMAFAVSESGPGWGTKIASR